MSFLPRRIGAGIALAAAAALILTSCASGDDTAGGDSDAATATSLSDFGTFADLEAAAKAEGALNVIALPRD